MGQESFHHSFPRLSLSWHVCQLSCYQLNCASTSVFIAIRQADQVRDWIFRTNHPPFKKMSASLILPRALSLRQ